MAITYPITDTTPQLKFARMQRRKRRLIKLHNIVGRWRKFNKNKWYIIKLNLSTGVGSGWKGADTIHAKVVRINTVSSYATKAEADTAFATLSNQTNKVVGQFGISQAMYDSLPLLVRNQFAFSNRLSAADWLTFKLWFHNRRRRITTELLIQEALVENDASGDSDASDI